MMARSAFRRLYSQWPSSGATRCSAAHLAKLRDPTAGDPHVASAPRAVAVFPPLADQGAYLATSPARLLCKVK